MLHYSDFEFAKPLAANKNLIVSDRVNNINYMIGVTVNTRMNIELEAHTQGMEYSSQLQICTHCLPPHRKNCL